VGESAFAAALLVAKLSLSRAGRAPWNFGGNHGLTLHVYTIEGEAISKPSAEVLMTQTAAEAMLEKESCRLLIKEQPVIRLVSLQSFADPPSALAGRWNL